MRLSTEQALQYLQDHGLKLSRATYFRYKRKVEEKKLERLSHMVQIGFQDQHLDRIDNIELALKEMWIRYIDEKDNFRKVLILEKIIMVQPYLSSYYEATAYVIDNRNDNKGLIQDHQISKSKQRNNSLVNIDSHKITNSYHYKINELSDLNAENQDEINKRVFDKFNHVKDNFVI